MTGTRSYAQINNNNLYHAFRHAYLHIHSHTLDFVRFVHALILTFACSKNTTWECQQHPIKRVTSQTIWIHIRCVIHKAVKVFHTIFGAYPGPATQAQIQASWTHTHILCVTYISCCESDHGEEDYAKFGLWHLCTDCSQHCHDGTRLQIKERQVQRLGLLHFFCVKMYEDFSFSPLLMMDRDVRWLFYTCS